MLDSVKLAGVMVRPRRRPLDPAPRRRRGGDRPALASQGAEGRRGVGVHFAGDLGRALKDAAIATLNEVGADRLSLRDVARRLGVSHAAPAHHFVDKPGLLTAVATEGFELFVVLMAAALGAAPQDPVRQLLTLGRAYAEFAERYPGHFEVMFRPALTRTDDPAYVAASDAAFEALRLQIERFQRAGWNAGADTRALTAASWALAHGIAVLRGQGSLAKHYRDGSLDDVTKIVATLVGHPRARRRLGTPHARSVAKTARRRPR